ncbi:HNH endonuclease signature motif containing protein [Aquipuribacter nitratireducens]|uniref:DUF222 domain-containing protein n=1 Tax=Aquipuribacter nitratireducens TaxID=650104 RepID=A0ABW0GI41_9MICO
MGPCEGEESQSTLRARLGRLRSALVDLADAVEEGAAWQVTDREVLDAIPELARSRALLESVHLRLVREVDQRGVAEASPVATSPEGFLRTACLVGPSQARRDVAAARALAPGEPLAPFAGALAEGRCTRAHVDTAVRCLDRIPQHVLDREGAGEKVAAYLLLATSDASPLDLERACRHLLATLAPERADAFDAESVNRRFLDLATDATGMTVGRFQLDPVTGAALRAALNRWSGPDPTGEAGDGPRRASVPGRGECADGCLPGADGERDRRQPRQRRADALAHLVETALGVAHPRRGERPRVVVHVTPEQLADHRHRASAGPVGLAEVEGGDPIPPWATRRLACDAVLQRIVDSPSAGPLDVGQEERLATLTQRRALAGRDQGCVIPGCGAAPAICDAHHVVHWADGGPTDLANLLLLCPGHHTAVHAGTWAVAIDEAQQVTVTPPRWVDPQRRPRPAWRQRASRLWRDTAPPDRPPNEPDRGTSGDVVDDDDMFGVHEHTWPAGVREATATRT